MIRRLLRITGVVGFVLILLGSQSSADLLLDPLRDLLVRTVTRLVSHAFQGTLEVGALQGTLLSAPVLQHVVLRDTDGTVVGQIDEIRLQYDLKTLLKQRLIVQQVDIVRPRLTVTQETSGKTNLARLFSSKVTKPPSPPEAPRPPARFGLPFAIVVEQLHIHDGQCTLRFPAVPGVDVVQGVQAALQGHIDQHEIYVLAHRLVAHDTSANVALQSVQGAVRIHPGSVQFEALQLQTNSSHLALSGVLPGKWRAASADLQAQQLEVAEVGRLLQQHAWQGLISLSLAAEGPLMALTVRSQLRSAGGGVDLDGHLNTEATPLQYRGTVDMTHLDLATLSAHTAFQSDINLRLHVNGEGTVLQSLRGQMQLEVQPSRVGSIAIHPSAIDLAIQAQRFEVRSLQLDTSMGYMTVNGAVDMAGQSSLQYDLAARLAPLRPLLGLDVLEGEVQGHGQVEGELTAMRTQGVLQARRLQYQEHQIAALTLTYNGQALATQPQVQAQVQAQQARLGTLAVEQLSVQAAYEESARQIHFSADVRQSSAYSGATRGTLTLAEAGQYIRLEDLRLRLADATWHTAEPVEVALAPRRIQLKRLKLIQAHESLEISGEINGDQLHNVQLQATRLDLGTLRRLVPLPALMGDRATAHLQLTGTLPEPVIQGELTLDAAAKSQLPAQHVHTTWRYEQQQFHSTVQLRQSNRDVLGIQLQLPVDLALTPLSLVQRLRDTPLALRMELKRPDLLPLQRWFAGWPACTGTMQGEVAVQGPLTALHLNTKLQLQDFGVAHVVEHVQSALQLTAVVVPAASLSALEQAFAQGDLAPRLQQLELRIPSARLHLPASTPAAPAVQIENLLAQAEGQWSRAGAQATLRTLHLQGVAFGLPRADLTVAGRLVPQQVELTRLQVRLPQSEVRGQGVLSRASQQVQLHLDVPRLRLDELWPAFPQGLPPEVRGSLEVQGSLAAPQLAARLQYASGQIAADLAAHWQERLPRYNATVRVDGLAMSQFLPKTTGQLQALLRLQGTGFDVAQRHAELNMQVDSKDFTLAPALQAQVRAILDGQAIQVPTLQVRSAPATLEASGALSARQQVALRYTLTLHDLQSLQNALGLVVQAKGSITGEVQGTLPDLQARSTMQLQEWAAAGLSGKQLRATLSATHFPAAPQATLTARLAAVQGPALPASALTFQAEYRAPRATLRVTMTAGPYVQSLLTGHVLLQDELRFTIERLRVRRGALTWETVKPVEVQRDPQGTLRMSELLLRSGTQRLRAQGLLTSQGMVDVTVQSQRLQLQSIVRVVAPESAFPSGQLATDIAVRGTIQQPHITGTVALTMLRWQDHEWGDIRARFDTIGETLSTDLRWQDHARELLQVSGTIGLGAAHPLALQVRTRDIDMARLPLIHSAILASAGALTIDAQLTGTLQQPLAHGELTLHNGALQLAMIGERYKDIQAQLAFAGNRVEIEHLQVGSRSGSVQLNGWLETAGLTISQLNVAIRADRFTAMHTPEVEAIVSAGIAVHGSLQDLSATGKVSIPRARVLMSGKLWGRPADVEPWELTIAGVYGAGPKGTSTATGNHTDIHKPVPLPFLSVDLSVDMPRNVWVQGSGTAIEVSGTMRVRKAAKEPFILDGTIETIRGFASFYGKKFVVQEGRVTFSGSEELNPFLDVTVTQTVANYDVSIHIDGKARKPTLTLSSTPDLPQAEIASLLVLGRTSEQRLTNSEQSALSGQVQQIISDVAASELEKAITQPLGLDTVEVEAGQTLGTGRVSVGRYVTQDIFLSYERQVGGEGENKVGIEYSINRRLKVKGSGSDTGESTLDLLWRLDY